MKRKYNIKVNCCKVKKKLKHCKRIELINKLKKVKGINKK